MLALLSMVTTPPWLAVPPEPPTATPRATPGTSGIEIATHTLAKALSERHEVVLYTAESDHARPRFEHTIRALDNLRIHQVIHNYRWTGFRDTYDCPEADAIFRRVLAEEQPDIVHVQHLHYGSANFVTIAKSLGIHVVFTLHDYWLLCPRDGQMRRADGEVCERPVPSKCRDCIAHFEVEARRDVRRVATLLERARKVDDA